ncbi:hypothetical protein IC617_08390 [Neiella sp. HB171785]|uniref:Uncharacterized protein n=1 Tax=Neiella litorisoli TaxID=2771431 RepID=A0A8J6QUS5_9GAMM|nr:hypothetical protein [Neiella litorisoli]MBD1389443.1 hypothetical protein [Neiella litorisoli]
MLTETTRRLLWQIGMLKKNSLSEQSAEQARIATNRRYRRNTEARKQSVSE